MKAVSAALEYTLQHPALRGHFPGNPIVPAVALLDAVLHLASTSRPISSATAPLRWQISHAKFHRPLRPDEPLALELERQSDASVRFTVSCAGAPVAQGLLLAATAPVRPLEAPLP